MVAPISQDKGSARWPPAEVADTEARQNALCDAERFEEAEARPPEGRCAAFPLRGDWCSSAWQLLGGML